MTPLRFLLPNDYEQLVKLNDQLNDSDAGGYTLSTNVINRLTQLGVVHKEGRGWCSLTEFGSWIIDGAITSSLPLDV